MHATVFLLSDLRNAFFKLEMIETNLYLVDLSVCAAFLDDVAITACFIDAGINLMAYDA